MRSLLHSTGLGGFFILLVTLSAVLLFVPRRPAPVHFTSLGEFRDFAQRIGLHFHSGSVQPEIHADNCFFADHALSFEDVCALSKLDCGRTPPWRGIIWVVRCSHAFSEFELSSIGGHRRLWGQVAAAGDLALLERVEELFGK